MFLDGADDAWTILKPVCTDESFNLYEVKGACPKVDGVHSVKLILNNNSSNVYSVTFKNSEFGGGDVSVGSVENDFKTKNVDVYSINGILVRKNANKDNALNGLPKGLYIVNGQKVIKL